MFIKCFNGTLGALVAFSVCCGALVLATLALHVMVIGGLTVWHITHS